jgi:hypothetical protein
MLDILEEDLSAEWNYKMAVQKGIHDGSTTPFAIVTEIAFTNARFLFLFRYTSKQPPIL